VWCASPLGDCVCDRWGLEEQAPKLHLSTPAQHMGVCTLVTFRGTSCVCSLTVPSKSTVPPRGGGFSEEWNRYSNRHAQGRPMSAICVQRFDDSLNSAIHITYRISLRSSSLREPRYPLLTVVSMVMLVHTQRVPEAQRWGCGL
jgi:hypothetical protein